MYRAFLVRVDGGQDPVTVLGVGIRDFVKREHGRVKVEYFQCGPGVKLSQLAEGQLGVRRVPCVDCGLGVGEIRIVGVVDEG